MSKYYTSAIIKRKILVFVPHKEIIMNYQQIKQELTKENELFSLENQNIKFSQPSSFTLKMRKTNNLIDDIVIDVEPYKSEIEKKEYYGFSIYFANMVSGDVIRNSIYKTNVLFDTDLTEEEYKEILENKDKLIGVNCKDINYGYMLNMKSKNFILTKLDKKDNLKLRVNNINNLIRNFYTNKEDSKDLTVEQYVQNCTLSNLLLKYVSKQVPAITLSSAFRSVKFFKESEDRATISKGNELLTQLEQDFDLIKNYNSLSASAARKWAQVQGVVQEKKQAQALQLMPQMDYDKTIVSNAFKLD